MEAEVVDLVIANGKVAGVRATTADGELVVRADLVVGADGRHSTVQARAGLETIDLGAPNDVLWCGCSRRPDDPEQTLGRFDAGRILVMLNRGDYWQCAFVVRKGGFDEIRRRGLPFFSRRGRAPGAPTARPHRRTRRLAGHQALDRRGRSFAGLAPARAAVHRRCRPCDVADWRGWDQPRVPGRGCRRQHPGGILAGRQDWRR
jgi:2-polyprenyl-6-methoxyphenol hydroxylase-like FAD-dependent oxidoreductase